MARPTSIVQSMESGHGRRRWPAALVPSALYVALCLWSIPARAQDEARNTPAELARGQVVQVTATEVFVDIGADAGVATGDRISVTVGRRRIEVLVLDTWGSGSRCRLGQDQPIPRVGAAASHAEVERASHPDAGPSRPPRKPVRRLAKPASMDALRPLWDGAARARPRLVRHGDTEERPADRPASQSDRTTGLFALEYSGLLDPRPENLDQQYHQIVLRSDLSVPALLDGRLTYSHRLRVRYDLAPDIDERRFSGSRSLIRIHQMRANLALGASDLDVGRTTAGPLPQAGAIDGASLRHRIAPALTVGAWVGAVPGITDLLPRFDAIAFGAYGSWRHELASRPKARMAVDGGLLGSAWRGALDRRAMAVRASMVEPRRWIHGQLVLDAGAPTRPAIEPSLAIVDMGWRILDDLRASVRFDHVRAVRTEEALASLPSRYLSTVAFTSVRAAAEFTVRRGLGVYARTGWRLSAEGAGSLFTSTGVRASGLWFGDDRATLAVDAALGSHLDGAAMRLGYSLPVSRRVEVSTGYRLYGYRYGGENQRLFVHHPSLGINAALPWRVHIDMDLNAYLGAEEMVLGLFASVARRF